MSSDLNVRQDDAPSLQHLQNGGRELLRGHRSAVGGAHSLDQHTVMVPRVLEEAVVQVRDTGRRIASVRLDALAQKCVERLARSSRHQHRLQQAARIVHPPLAGLVHEGQRREAPHPLVRRMRRHRNGRTVDELELVDRLLDRRIVEQDTETEREGQEIAHNDRPKRRHGVIERSVDAAQHAPVRQVRKPALRRRIQGKSAFLRQHHDGSRGEGLGHRGDAEDRVALHRCVGADRLGPKCFGMDRVATGDQIDRARHDAVRDARVQRLAYGVQTF